MEAENLIKFISRERGRAFKTDKNTVLYGELEDNKIEVSVQETGVLYGTYPAEVKCIIDYETVKYVELVVKEEEEPNKEEADE
uniref:Uncharacterized protein n=1 Tax=Pithovirus LCPAC404 TaxID=2506597 RepID=A0A481ZCM0_9VIRU|nr:MAG: hypothetical protein LCPAC404_02310 [Pithovirus LCPAC404]